MDLVRGLLVLVASILSVMSNEHLTPSQLKFLKKAARRQIKKDIELLPRLVQMSFHDCVEGCDGCLDLSNPGNKGLDSTLEFSRNFRRDYAPHLSNADIISLLGVSALEKGAEDAGGEVKVPYMTGRIDCPSPSEPPHRHLPHGTALDAVDILKKEFNLTTPEAVALLGCHSLGHGHADRSGFSGAWDHSPFKLDSGYFKSLRGAGWEPIEVNNTNVESTAWTQRSGLLMLHADMILFRSFNVSGPYDTPSCVTECKRAPTAKLVNRMGNNQTYFHEELSRAFDKMINSPELSLVE